MADIGDILGKKKRSDKEERVDIDGMCGYQIAFGESCYFPYDHGYYDPVKKTLTIVCDKGHEVTIPWEMQVG